ncbi:MAG: acyl carrier protein [Acidimicrobiales bacterium]
MEVGPLTRDAARELFAKAFAEVCPPTELDFADDLAFADLGVSSMDLVEIQMVLGEFGVAIPEDAFTGVETVGDVLDVVVSLGQGE